MKLKFIAAGILAAASFSASATDHLLGILDPAGSDTLSDKSDKFALAGTTISDSWFFQLLTPSATSFGALQTFSVAEGAITSFAGMLYDVNTNVSYGALTNTVAGSNQNLSWSGGLATGSYRVDITGVTAVDRTQYISTVAALPVPEPETYGMMLAGLALVGAVARRRIKKTA